jgi:hypothetical protein
MLGRIIGRFYAGLWVKYFYQRNLLISMKFLLNISNLNKRFTQNMYQWSYIPYYGSNKYRMVFFKRIKIKKLPVFFKVTIIFILCTPTVCAFR